MLLVLVVCHCQKAADLLIGLEAAKIQVQQAHLIGGQCIHFLNLLPLLAGNAYGGPVPVVLQILVGAQAVRV